MAQNLNRTLSFLLAVITAFSCMMPSVSAAEQNFDIPYSQEAGTADTAANSVNDTLNEDTSSVITDRGIYLSDLPYIADGTNIGWGSYGKDTNSDGNPIQLRIDGSVVTFDKGIGAHAESTITYDISAYSNEYTRFCAKLGVNASKGSYGYLRLRIMVSNVITAYTDNTGWTELFTSEPLTAASAAVSVDLNVAGYRYIRLYADPLESNGHDHSVFADARLVLSDYNIDSEFFPRLKSIEWYNAELAKHDYSYNLANNTDLLLEREFVSRMGLTNIQNCVKSSETMSDTLNWLLDDTDALQLLIETGNIHNSANVLQNLDILYTKYRNILGDSGDAYVYKKMLIALAVTWSSDTVRTPYKFGGTVMYIDMIERFETAKWVYDSGVLMYSKEMYASYNMELMRTVMSDYIGIDEVKWVQAYAAKKYPDTPGAWTGPYRFMNYVHPPYYSRPEYFSAETWSAYDTKYDLTSYNILRTEQDSPVMRMWMVYEAGGICWNISRIGQTLNKSYGIPAVGTFQPSHEAYFVYSENEDGMGIWSIGNNVFGWQNSYNNWGGLTYRLPLNWGSGTSYSNSTKNNSTYILLAQGALNRYDELRESMYLNMLADAYTSAEDKLEIYEASLNALEINLDTYLDIINQYISMGDSVSSDVWYALAMKIIDVYTYYPVPMVDLITAIEPYLGDHTTFVNIAKINALKKAKTATSAESLQYGACITLATSMLGESADDLLATFSFNGENAGAIVIGESYDQYDFQLQYSLDGGSTWVTYNKGVGGDRIIKLTPEQISSIRAETDILMFISGEDVNGENPEYFTIDIQEAVGAPTVGTSNASVQINIHDGENWIVGKTANLEYSTDGGITWTMYIHGETYFPGAQTILVRYAANGTYLVSDSTEISFTANETETFSHISVSDVQLISASDGKYYNNQTGELALDASPFTGWHSAANTSKDIVVRFSEVKSFSGITYDSEPSGHNGRIRDLDVYASMDGQTWIKVGSAAGWAGNGSLKTLKLDKVISAQYVKLVATYTYGNGNESPNKYVSGRDIDFYEDTTVEALATSINYSVTEPTRDNVTATLMLVEGYTAVGEAVHTFTENGSYTFVYTDADGAEYTLTAVVDWIDRDAPTATVEYSSTDFTEAIEGVTATIIPSEDITVTNNGGELSYTFTDNGSFTFEFVDAAGNAGSVTASVNWIIPADDKQLSFSFSGENGGKFILNTFYDDLAVDVTYSLDGGITEKTVNLGAEDEKIIALSLEEMASLEKSADSDGEIVVTVSVTSAMEMTHVQTIDITVGPDAPVVGRSSASTQINIHDGENWILGKTANLEYSTDDLTWTPYIHGTTYFHGDQAVLVRYKADGLTRPSQSITLNFTDDESDAFRHISVSDVTLVRDNSAGYYQNRKGNLAIDANPFTSWHSSANQTAENKVFVVKFSEVKSFSGFTYQTEGSNGRFRYVDVYVSLDGVNWVLAGSSDEWGSGNTALKTVRLDRSVSAQYVKLQAETWNSYISARDIDFYEDTTAEAKPIDIVYSTVSLTNGDVTATLMLPDGYTADSTVYVFTENGTYNFTYTAGGGDVQTVTAYVDWIDKTPPTATVTYSPESVTTGNVVATVVPSEDVTVTNNGGSDSYTFTANGSFTFEFVDAAGNTGSATATVNWIAPDSGDAVSFSFSGENAGAFVLNSFFEFRDVQVTYSLCGGESVTVELGTEDTKIICLSPEELDVLLAGTHTTGAIVLSVTSGDGYTNTQTINLSTSGTPIQMVSGSPNAATQIAIHDGEDHIIGNTAYLEYSSDGMNWTPYVHGETRFHGDQTIYVRYGAHDLYIHGQSIQLTFTEGNTPEFTYIPSDRVTLVNASNGQYYQNNKGEYALDANPFTFWHSAQNSSKEISVSFDRVRTFAGFTYTLLDSSRNGRFLSVDVYVSLDGQTWEKAGEATGWSWIAYPAVNAPKTLTLENPVQAKYVKLVPTETTGAFATARDIDFYEDTTANIASVGGEKYCTLEDAFAAAGDAGEVILTEGNDSELLRSAITALAEQTGDTVLTIPSTDKSAFVTIDRAVAKAVINSGNYEFTYIKAVVEASKINKIAATSIVISDSIAINYKYTVDTEYEIVRVEFTLGETKTVIDASAATIDSSGRYVFRFDEINPCLIDDTVSSVAVVRNSDGLEIGCVTQTYSITTYVNRKISTENEVLKSILASLVNYADASSAYVDETAPLPSASVTDWEIYKSAVAPIRTYNSIQKIGSEITSPEIRWGGFTPMLTDSIDIQISFEGKADENHRVSAVFGKNTYYYDVTVGENKSYFTLDNYSFSQISSPFIFTVIDGDGKAVSNTLTFNVESYVANMVDSADENLANLLIALMQYGDAAKIHANS